MFYVKRYIPDKHKVVIFDSNDGTSEGYNVGYIKKKVNEIGIFVAGLGECYPLDSVEHALEYEIKGFMAKMLEESDFKEKLLCNIHFNYLDEGLYGLDYYKFYDSNDNMCILSMYSDLGYKSITCFGIDIKSPNVSQFLDSNKQFSASKLKDCLNIDISVANQLYSIIDLADSSIIHIDLQLSDLLALQNNVSTKSLEGLKALLNYLCN